MKRGLIILTFLTLILPLASAAHIPEDCSDIQIKGLWDSIFDENSDNITIFTNNIIESGRCQEYFAYKIDESEAWYIQGETPSEDKTKITSNKLNATQAFITILGTFSHITDTDLLKNQNIINYAQTRSQNLTENTLDNAFSPIYRESAGEWAINSDIASPIPEDKVYSFLIQNTLSQYTLSKTAHITTIADYTSLIFEYNHAAQNQNGECTANFTCGSWSDCINGNMTRTCVDMNGCNPVRIEKQACQCTPNWNCSDWSECIGNQQVRICLDLNTCQTDSGKPSETKSCGDICEPNWHCTDWAPKKCDDTKTQYRNCTDHNSCNNLAGMPEESKSCSYIANFAWMIFFILLIIIILILGVVSLLKKRLKKQQTKTPHIPLKNKGSSKPL